MRRTVADEAAAKIATMLSSLPMRGQLMPWQAVDGRTRAKIVEVVCRRASSPILVGIWGTKSTAAARVAVGQGYGYLDQRGIHQPVEELKKCLAETVERFYGAKMPGRVADAFYRPTRLAELQASITDPLARIVDQNERNPLAVAGPILAEAAKNLDVSFSAREPGRIALANPSQALRDTAGMVSRSYSRLCQVFGRPDAQVGIIRYFKRPAPCPLRQPAFGQGL